MTTTLAIQETWRRFRGRGDLRARETLIDNYRYLVRITAGRIAGGVPSSLDREDLVSAGMIGLIRAVDQFDHTRKVKFETYAIALIRGAILELLRSEDWAPRSIRDKIRTLERAYGALELRHGRPGTEEEVAAELDIPVEALHKMLGEVGHASLLSLDQMLFATESEGSIRVVDTVEDPGAAGRAEGRVTQDERLAALQKALARLPEREGRVLTLYYYGGNTFKEIGRQLSVSESRVFQLHQQAMIRLRGYLAADRDLFSG